MLHLIEDLGYDLDEFRFVRKDDWVHVYHEPSNQYYGYQSRRHVPLNPLMQKWRGQESYRIRTGNGEFVKLDGDRTADSLVAEFENWMVSLAG